MVSVNAVGDILPCWYQQRLYHSQSQGIWDLTPESEKPKMGEVYLILKTEVDDSGESRKNIGT
jgi:hypothetical protein